MGTTTSSSYLICLSSEAHLIPCSKHFTFQKVPSNETQSNKPMSKKKKSLMSQWIKIIMNNKNERKCVSMCNCGGINLWVMKFLGSDHYFLNVYVFFCKIMFCLLVCLCHMLTLIISKWVTLNSDPAQASVAITAAFE